MTFTDDDLKRLKEISAISPGDWNTTEAFGLLPALLARLEAAERVCGYVYGFPDYRDLTERQLLFEWRKAAGLNG